ncbi:hypothetical protein KM043_016713 [Ampulex compressa]|nr:hypothetical protein KM043_016713 [Ampulex compressa]
MLQQLDINAVGSLFHLPTGTQDNTRVCPGIIREVVPTYQKKKGRRSVVLVAWQGIKVNERTGATYYFSPLGSCPLPAFGRASHSVGTTRRTLFARSLPLDRARSRAVSLPPTAVRPLQEGEAVMPAEEQIREEWGSGAVERFPGEGRSGRP